MSMKKFFLKYRKLHIWLAADLGLLAAYFLLRGQRKLMNALAFHVTGPFRRGIGRVCYLVPFSVMEVVVAGAVLAAVVYLAWSIAAVIRTREAGDGLFRRADRPDGSECGTGRARAVCRIPGGDFEEQCPGL